MKTDLGQKTVPVAPSKQWSSDQPTNTIKHLMYGGGFGTSSTPTYRTERGFPFQRGGKTIAAVPQFKGLNLFAHTTASALNSFAITTPTITITWPTKIK
jgi:hypothetical protein